MINTIFTGVGITRRWEFIVTQICLTARSRACFVTCGGYETFAICCGVKTRYCSGASSIIIRFILCIRVRLRSAVRGKRTARFIGGAVAHSLCARRRGVILALDANQTVSYRNTKNKQMIGMLGSVTTRGGGGGEVRPGETPSELILNSLTMNH